jgi:hypothetical protein
MKRLSTQAFRENLDGISKKARLESSSSALCNVNKRAQSEAFGAEDNVPRISKKPRIDNDNSRDSDGCLSDSEIWPSIDESRQHSPEAISEEWLHSIFEAFQQSKAASQKQHAVFSKDRLPSPIESEEDTAVYDSEADDVGHGQNNEPLVEVFGARSPGQAASQLRQSLTLWPDTPATPELSNPTPAAMPTTSPPGIPQASPLVQPRSEYNRTTTHQTQAFLLIPREPKRRKAKGRMMDQNVTISLAPQRVTRRSQPSAFYELDHHGNGRKVHQGTNTTKLSCSGQVTAKRASRR